MAACVMAAILAQVVPVGAVPALPSSFYGTVRVNAANVPDGTQVQALIDGQVVAEGVTQTYQGDSVYVLDVPSDNPDTEAQDGGRDGNVIQFKVGGALADQTGEWRSGTNVNLNLTAASAAPVNTPAPTLPPPPTQTAIVILTPTALPTQTALATLTAPAIFSGPGASETLPPAALAPSSETIPAPFETRVKISEPGGVSRDPSAGSGGSPPQTRGAFPPQAIGAILIALVVVAFSIWRIGSRRK